MRDDIFDSDFHFTVAMLTALCFFLQKFQVPYPLPGALLFATLSRTFIQHTFFFFSPTRARYYPAPNYFILLKLSNYVSNTSLPAVPSQYDLLFDIGRCREALSAGQSVKQTSNCKTSIHCYSSKLSLLYYNLLTSKANGKQELLIWCEL